MGETCSLHARELLSRKGKMDMLVKPKITRAFSPVVVQNGQLNKGLKGETLIAMLNTHFYHHQRDLEKRHSIAQIISNIAYIWNVLLDSLYWNKTAFISVEKVKIISDIFNPGFKFYSHFHHESVIAVDTGASRHHPPCILETNAIRATFRVARRNFVFTE